MSQRHTYATLFDRNYYAQGLAMLRSLIRHSSTPPIVHVLAMDKDTENWLRATNLDGVCITPHRDFEVLNNTVALQHTRTFTEYCWTCASLFTLHVAPLASYNLTYLDADLYFFSDPQTIHDEIADRSIGIIPHRFNAEYQTRYGINGKFNVSWVTFKGVIGRQCLQDWAIKCREWCYYRHEDSKFADQLYLEQFGPRFGDVNVCEISNIGAGAAPWNLRNYKVSGGPYVNGVPIVFYHFHSTKFHKDGSVKHLSNHPVRQEDLAFVYSAYTDAVLQESLKIAGTLSDSGGSKSNTECQNV